MGERYYDNRDPPPGQGQYYAPPSQAQYQAPGYGDPRYASPQQEFYPQHPQQANGYQPYGSPHNAQVGPYGGYNDERRQSRHEHRGSDAGYYYDEPPRDRRRSRDDYGSGERRRHSEVRGERHREGEKKGGHKSEKSLGATLLGAAGGAFVGHEVAPGGLGTVVGILAGAFGAHELEKRHEKKKGKNEKGFDDRGERPPRRRHSRARSQGARDESDSYSESESDDGRRRSRHRHY